MGYTKQNFTDGQVLKAEHLIKIEEGIINAEKSGGTVDTSKLQEKLVSGTNIKTINGQSVLGSGDIEIDGTIVDEYLEEVGVAIKGDDDIAWGVQDSSGNFAMKIDNDGTVNVGKIKVTKLVTDGGSTDSWLTGKHCYVLGDSLSADTKGTGSWHQKFCELTGAILDDDLNRNWFSIGGTATIGTHTEKDACCQMRAKRLVEHYKAGNPVDVIFIQNVNDINNNSYSAGINGKGTNADLPFFENQVITYTDDVVEVTTPSTEVMTYFKSNFDTILANVTPMTGTVIDMLYTKGGSSAKELTITSEATADGNITLTMKHGANYRDDVFNVAVKAGMSKEQIVDAICEWQFQGVSYYDDVRGENGDSVVFSSPYSLTFDGGSTGVTATVSDTGSISRYPIAFKSLDVTEFNNVDSWGAECRVSYWSGQKGLFEYLQTNIPNAKIFYLILPYYKVKYPADSGSSFLRPDGSFNMEYWVSQGRGGVKAGELYAEQPLVANYYGSSYIDVVNNCSISPINIESYYPSNDVHPSTAGYNAWGETVARILTGK